MPLSDWTPEARATVFAYYARLGAQGIVDASLLPDRFTPSIIQGFAKRHGLRVDPEVAAANKRASICRANLPRELVDPDEVELRKAEIRREKDAALSAPDEGRWRGWRCMTKRVYRVRIDRY